MRLIRKLRRLVPVLALLAAILQLVSACSPPPPMATPAPANGNPNGQTQEGQPADPNAPRPTMMGDPVGDMPQSTPIVPGQQPTVVAQPPDGSVPLVPAGSDMQSGLTGVAHPMPDDPCKIIVPAGATHIEPSDPNAICYMGHQLDIRGRPITPDQLLIMTEDDPNSVIDERVVPRAVMAPDGEHPLFRDGSVVYWIGERQGTYGLIVNTFRTRLQIGDVSRGQLIVQGDDLLILSINDSQLSAEIDPNMPMMPGQAGEKRGFTVLLKIGEQEGQINYLRIANFTYEDIRDANGNLGSDGVLDTVKFMFHANTQVYSENFEPLE